MPHEDARKKKLERLKQTLANKDFAQARRLLENNDAETDVDRRKTLRAGLPLCAVERDAPQNVLPDTTSHSAKRQAVAKHVPKISIPSLDAPEPFWSMHTTLAQASPEWLAVAREFAAVLRGARQRVDELAASAALCHVQNARPEDLLFTTIDTDPTDADGPIVLVSVMRFEHEQLVFEHLLARSRDEEPAVLNALARRLEETGVLAAFDNKSLDLAHLRQRAADLDVDLGDRLPPRLNLHDESRRRWQGKLPNFRLNTLEKLIGRRLRRDDPTRPNLADARRQFLTDHNPAPLADALHHLRLDLLTQAQLLTAILTQCDPEALDDRTRRG